MANPINGEIDIVANGKTYTLCFTSEAIISVEDLLGADISEISGKSSVGNIRALLWGALRQHHGEVDLVGAGPILDGYEGGVTGLFEQLVRALRFRLSRTAIDAPFGEAVKE